MIAEDAFRQLELLPKSERSTYYCLIANQLSCAIKKFQWSRYAAILGVRDAIHSIVNSYQVGEGTEPSSTSAFEWIRAAAEAGHEEFFFDLAMSYRDGDGVVPNITAFWDWMLKATESSQAKVEAMFQMAEAHRKPELGRLSISKSFEWTRRMAECGGAGAMIQLSRQYRDGDGIAQDADMALKWALAAVKSSEAEWRNALSDTNDEYIEELTLEDRPEALEVAGEAYLILKKTAKAKNTFEKASIAALEAAEFAIKRAGKNDPEISLRLPDIMAGKLVRLLDANCDVQPRQKDEYLTWALKVDAVLEQVKDKSAEFPDAIKKGLYGLARVYRTSSHTSQDQIYYLKYLKKAAEIGHGDAAYEYAMHCLTELRRDDFLKYIEISIHAGSLRALIARALLVSGVSEPLYQKILPMLHDLYSVVEQVRQDKHVLNGRESREGLAHYTDAAALNSMLAGDQGAPRNSIRLYSIAYVNDPKEGRRLQSLDCLGGNPLKELFPDDPTGYSPIHWEEKELHVFIGCFSLEQDNLDLWRFYGRDGKGFSIVSPVSAFSDSSAIGMAKGPWTKESTKTKLTLYKVLYEDRDAKAALDKLTLPLKTISSQISEIQKELPAVAEQIRKVAAFVVSELLFLYKDRSYAHEREIRVVQARTLNDPDLKAQMTGNGFSKLFVETPGFLFHESGSKIVVGPKVENQLIAMIDIRHRLALHNWNKCDVHTSKVAYR